jgi:hypothetical protein
MLSGQEARFQCQTWKLMKTRYFQEKWPRVMSNGPNLIESLPNPIYCQDKCEEEYNDNNSSNNEKFLVFLPPSLMLLCLIFHCFCPFYVEKRNFIVFAALYLKGIPVPVAIEQKRTLRAGTIG